jgi:hypothetical protein
MHGDLIALPCQLPWDEEAPDLSFITRTDIWLLEISQMVLGDDGRLQFVIKGCTARGEAPQPFRKGDRLCVVFPLTTKLVKLVSPSPLLDALNSAFIRKRGRDVSVSLHDQCTSVASSSQEERVVHEKRINTDSGKSFIDHNGRIWPGKISVEDEEFTFGFLRLLDEDRRREFFGGYKFLFKRWVQRLGVLSIEEFDGESHR